MTASQQPLAHQRVDCVRGLGIEITSGHRGRITKVAPLASRHRVNIDHCRGPRLVDLIDLLFLWWFCLCLRSGFGLSAGRGRCRRFCFDRGGAIGGVGRTTAARCEDCKSEKKCDESFAHGA